MPQVQTKVERTNKKRTPAANGRGPAMHPQEKSPRDRLREADAAWSPQLKTADLEEQERAFLAVCQKMFRECGGCITPVEEFFSEFVDRIKWGYWPTPDDVKQLLGEFELNWNDAIRGGRWAQARYPALIAESQPSA